MKYMPKNRGFMKTIIIFIAVIAAIMYFDINVRAIVESEFVQDSIALAKNIYAGYIKPLIVWVDGYIPQNIKDIFTKNGGV